MRTYTVRDVRGAGADTRLVVDIVVHADEHGEPGPGLRLGRARRRSATGWSLMAPRRGQDFGGIEFEPGTAAPAAARRRRDRRAGDLRDPRPAAVAGAAARRSSRCRPPPTCRPSSTRRASRSSGWPATATPHGARLHAAVLDHLGVGAGGRSRSRRRGRPRPVGDPDVLLLRRGGRRRAATVVGHDLDDLYAWIAGESGVVTALRRVLVKDLGDGPPPGGLHGLLAPRRRDELLTPTLVVDRSASRRSRWASRCRWVVDGISGAAGAGDPLVELLPVGLGVEDGLLNSMTISCSLIGRVWAVRPRSGRCRR